MTDDELVGLARQGLNMAITEHCNTGRGALVLASYHAGQGLHRMRKIEKMLAGRLGDGWLDDEHKKDLGFGFIRMTLNIALPDAIIMAAPWDLVKPTEKFEALPAEEQKRLALSSDHDQMTAAGLFRIVDGYNASVQTPERVCFATQEVDHHGRLIGQPEVQLFDQADVGGRMKMYGEDKLEAERQKARAN